MVPSGSGWLSLFILIEYFAGTINQANIISSDDHGRTWKPGGVVEYAEHQATGNAIHSSEPTVRNKTNHNHVFYPFVYFDRIL